MRIGVNTRLLLKNKLEGIGWYTHELLSRIVRNNPSHEFVFFFDRPYDASFVFESNVRPVILKPQARHPFLYYLWTEIAIPKALRKYKIDVYFSPDGLGLTKQCNVPCVLTIHDLAYLHYPEFMSKLDKWHYGQFYPKFASNAAKVLTVSNYTKTDIATNYQIPAEKIKVIYNGPHQQYRPLSFTAKKDIKDKYTGGCEFFLFIGALHPRKNIINLLKAFVKFKRRQNTKMKLVVVGRMAWQFKEIEEAKNFMPYKEDVIWTGYLDVQDLANVTASAYALVYPSLFEGFGIPLVEAMACNVPSITSNVSSLPEIAGDTALLCDPLNVDDIAAKMSLMYTNEILRKKLINACENQLEKFNWDMAAVQLMQCIDDVYQNK